MHHQQKIFSIFLAVNQINNIDDTSSADNAN